MGARGHHGEALLDEGVDGGLVERHEEGAVAVPMPLQQRQQQQRPVGRHLRVGAVGERDVRHRALGHAAEHVLPLERLGVVAVAPIGSGEPGLRRRFHSGDRGRARCCRRRGLDRSGQRLRRGGGRDHVAGRGGHLLLCGGDGRVTGRSEGRHSDTIRRRGHARRQAARSGWSGACRVGQKLLALPCEGSAHAGEGHALLLSHLTQRGGDGRVAGHGKGVGRRCDGAPIPPGQAAGSSSHLAHDGVTLLHREHRRAHEQREQRDEGRLRRVRHAARAAATHGAACVSTQLLGDIVRTVGNLPVLQAHFTTQAVTQAFAFPKVHSFHLLTRAVLADVLACLAPRVGTREPRDAGHRPQRRG